MRPQKIAIDCRFASTVGGLGTYTRSLVQTLVQEHPEVTFVLFVRSTKEAWLDELSSPSLLLQECAVPHYSVREQCILPFLLWKHGATSLFTPHFNIPFLATIPITMVVHDLILHRFPNTQSFLQRMLYRPFFFFAVLRAKHIISITEATKHDLLSVYPWKSAFSVSVVYPGTTLQQAVKKHPYHQSRPYFLYVGNAKEHKNVQFLVDAFLSTNLSSSVDLLLVTSGKEAEHLSLPSSVRRISNCTDADLFALYSSALGFVTASRAEGFCLPCIEAMRARTRVLAPNIPPFPEVCSHHALLVPLAREAFVHGMQHIASELPDERCRILDDAALFSERYSWKTAAHDIFPHLLV